MTPKLPPDVESRFDRAFSINQPGNPLSGHGMSRMASSEEYKQYIAAELDYAKSVWQSQLRKEIEGVIGEDELAIGYGDMTKREPSVDDAIARNKLRARQRIKLLNLLQETK